MSDILQVLAIVCFLCACVLAYADGRHIERRDHGGLWAVLVSLGLALWLLSETRVLR
jgi:hypothetical protein